MRQIVTFSLLLLSLIALGQEIKTSDFTQEIMNHDLSDLWTLEKFEIENDTISIRRAEPLGYIGENFQRFRIHFISVIQNPYNKLQYFVYGKTKVEENICSFQGSIFINESSTYNEGDIPMLKQGFVKGQYEFFEDSHQKGTGILRGDLRTDFYIDEDGNLKYDALVFAADGFQNNQFEGTWKSYNSASLKKCNWGDYRIPDSQGLDIGAGEFSPWDKYNAFGWAKYNKAKGYLPATLEVQEARKKENEKWWLIK